MAAAKKPDLEYLLAQARRISEHREAGAEKEIRRVYRSMLKDLKGFVAEAYEKYAKDDKLTYADLQAAGYSARFLDEIEQKVIKATPKAAKELHQLVNDTYKLAYDGMVDAVRQAGAEGLDEAFADSIAITPEQIRKVVDNPIMEAALEKNHKAIIYDIKQAVAVGLMNGDRYTTMAQRISEKVDGEFYRSVRIARTETHRVREAGNHDAALEVDNALQKGTTGLRFVKIWRTMKDERVRPQRRKRGKRGGWSSKMGGGPNHMILDGQTVLEDEPFDLKGGAKAMAPGQSGVAGHDINCRCYASRKMMTDEEYFKATGKHFPGWKQENEQPTAKQETEAKKPTEATPDAPQESPKVVSLADRLSGAKTTRDVSEIAQEYFRDKEGCNIRYVNFGKCDVSAAKDMAAALDRLDSTYKSALTELNVGYLKPGLSGECAPSRTAFQKVLDTGDWTHYKCTINLNESLLRTKKAIANDFAQANRPMYGGGVAHCAQVDEKYASIATLVHEFGHSICPGKANEIYQQQVGINPNYMPFRRMYNTYMRELQGIEREIMKVRESYAGQPDGLAKGIEAAKDLQAKYDSLCISKYSKSSVGEFIAEAFCDAELSSNPKPASLEVKKTIVKIFGKDDQK